MGDNGKENGNYYNGLCRNSAIIEVSQLQPAPSTCTKGAAACGLFEDMMVRRKRRCYASSFLTMAHFFRGGLELLSPGILRKHHTSQQYIACWVAPDCHKPVVLVTHDEEQMVARTTG